MSKAYDVLKNINGQSKLLLWLIQKKGPITRNQIMDITKMKLNTLKRFMQPLLDEGFIIEADIGESTGGRPPVLYDVNPKAYYIIGIDISRLYTEVAITNLKMNIIDLHRFPAPSSPQATIRQISAYVNRKLEQLSLHKSMALGVGIGAVGPLNRNKGIIVNPVNFSTDTWANVPIKDIVEQELKLPAILDNGANAAVLAERFFGIGKDIDNISYFNCGVGIRTGTIYSGNIINSINDHEDAFGHMVIDVDGELCHCGDYGCIESYCSIPSITNNFVSELRKGRSSFISKPIEELNYLDICNAADKNDDLAREVIINAATLFGVGLANYINLLNPKLVILSGPLIKSSSLFYKTCVKEAQKRQYIKNASIVGFSRGGHFKDNAISVGAAVEFVEEMLNMGKEWERL